MGRAGAKEDRDDHEIDRDKFEVSQRLFELFADIFNVGFALLSWFITVLVTRSVNRDALDIKTKINEILAVQAAG